MKINTILFAAAVGLAISGAPSEAANISMEVYAQGKWALIVPGSNTGGRVVWSAGHGRYITDRAQRGESMCIFATASTARESANPVIYWSQVSSTGGSFRLGMSCLPASKQITVPVSPNWDNNCVQICTASGQFQQPIPVGSRP